MSMEKTYDLTRSQAAEAAAYLVINGIWCSIHPIVDGTRTRSQLVTLDDHLANYLVNKAIVMVEARQMSIVDLVEKQTL